MEFFGREEELRELRKVRETARRHARFTVVTGRRRVGKTELLKRAFGDGKTPCLYLLVTRKTEKVQCAAFQQEVEKVLGVRIPGKCERFKEVFEEIMAASVSRTFTVVIDEFQEFDRVNPGVFGDVQGVWDEYHVRSKVNLVVCGSVNRLMNKIFFNDAEPLYGRNTGKLHLHPFKVSLLKRIFKHYHPNYTQEELLVLWALTGGIARYVDLLMSNDAFTVEDMLSTVFGRITSFVDEGKTVLVEEFGKDYGTYFTILASIASGRTTFAEIKNELGLEVGGFLTKLEDDYSLIAKKQPLFEKTGNKNSHYQIDDCFFRFWFRFVFKYQYLVELGRFDELRALVKRDLNVFCGYSLERYFYWKFVEETSYTRMGGWWDRKGENEIDLVCDDEFAGKLVFHEVKVSSERIDLKALKAKSEAFFAKNPDLKDRKVSFRALSLKDM